MTEQLVATLLDMAWHQPQGEDPVSDVAAFEAVVLAQANIELPYVPPVTAQAIFSIFGVAGYNNTASYYGRLYAYLWIQMLADDAYAAFEEARRADPPPTASVFAP